jgi:integrase
VRKPAYVSAYRDRHGVLRWRYRRPGFPQSQSREQFGTEAWWAWYAAAEAAQKIPVGASRTLPGSLSELAVAYYGSSDFKLLAPITRQTYRNIIDRFRDQAGALPVAKITSVHVRKWVDNRADRPAAANTFLKVLRALTRFGLARQMVKVDPTLGVPPVKNKTDGHHTWTEAEIKTYEKRWPLGTRERLAFDLLLYTAQRSGDVRQMGRQHILDGHMVVRQEKTGQPLEVPIHPRLSESIAAHDSGQLVFVATQHGKPYTARGFGNWFNDSAIEAGLPKGRTAHGLRKAAARRLAEAGATAHQIAAVTGHQTLKEVERYTRAAAQKALAGDAMRKVQPGTDAEQPCLTSPDSVRQSAS